MRRQGWGEPKHTKSTLSLTLFFTLHKFIPFDQKLHMIGIVIILILPMTELREGEVK